MFSKEKKRWLRALEIAKTIFEEEGYHCLYLQGIEDFIRRKTMYSPKIREDLIPRIYRLARRKHLKMTTLVNLILEKALDENDDLEAKKARVNPAFKLNNRKGGTS